jgi:hypothetical protein
LSIRTILIGHSMGGIIACDSVRAMLHENDCTHDCIVGILAFDTPYLGLTANVIPRKMTGFLSNVFSILAVGAVVSPELALVGASVAAVTAISAGAVVITAGNLEKHLGFASILYADSDDLEDRLVFLNDMKGIGFSNFYTVIGTRADGGGGRTFCELPQRFGEQWTRQQNDYARDEIAAHCGMFSPESNDHYEDMCWRSARLIKLWLEEHKKSNGNSV